MFYLKNWKMQSRKNRIKELESNEIFLNASIRELKQIKDQLLADLKHKDETYKYASALQTQMEGVRLGFLERENTELKSKIEELESNSVSDLENSVNEMMIDALMKTIEGLTESKETDWEKKYHKVIDKLEKITNKKPF